MADVNMEVTSWSGEWGLPSIDIDCLEVLVCIITIINNKCFYGIDKNIFIFIDWFAMSL